MISIREYPYLTIYWDDECRSIISRWRGGFIGRNIKEGLNAGLEELIKRRPYAQWIGDTTQIGVIGADERDWINTDWNPRFLATGVSFMAVVKPISMAAQLSVNQLVSTVPGTSLTIYRCESIEEAIQWMKAQKF